METKFRSEIVGPIAAILFVLVVFVFVTWHLWHGAEQEQMDYRITPRGTTWTVIESLEYSGAITPEQAKKSMEYLKHPKKMEWPKE